MAGVRAVGDRVHRAGRPGPRNSHAAAAGDYLAIVTLGFGEIIRLMADNLSAITNGSRGSTRSPSRTLVKTACGRYFSSGNALSSVNYGTWWFWLV